MQKKDLRIVFMGTPDYAKICLEKIVENGFNVVGVFSKPDEKQGRKMQIMPSAVKEYAMQKGFSIIQPKSFKAEKEEILSFLDKAHPDVILVVSYGKILPKYILDYPRFGCINAHGSLLPKYRGAAPIQWSIINGDEKTGVSIMYMDEGMDTGSVIAKYELPILSSDTYGTLYTQMANLSATSFIDVLNRICEEEGVLKSFTQEGVPSIANMIERENTRINFENSAKSIVNLVRGTVPSPVSWCMQKDNVLKIYSAHVVEEESIIKEIENENITFEIGEVVLLKPKTNNLVIKVSDGYISIDSLKPAGSKQMTSGDYIRGNKIHIKDRLM